MRVNVNVLERIVGCASSLRPSPQTLDAHEKRAIVITVYTRATEPALKVQHNAMVQEALAYRNVRFPAIADVCSAGQHDEMANEDALSALGQYLHQDIDIGAKTEFELARNVITLMSPAERTALHAYLSTALNRFSASELKGKLNRATRDWRFSSKGADTFLRAAFRQLNDKS